jgi:hypothetical protein
MGTRRQEAASGGHTETCAILLKKLPPLQKEGDAGMYIAIAPNNDISAQYVCNVCMGHAYNGLLVSCLPEEGTSEATLTSHWRPYCDLLHSPEEGGRLFYRRTNQVRVWPP